MTTARRIFSRQRGVAVVTALLLTTLAITIVASLFWQQQVQVRLIENQRYQLQKQWVLRGALDWAQVILREDVPTHDNLLEPWAVPLAPTRLDEYVENESPDGEVGRAILSGQIIDAQSRYNLNNLAQQGNVSPGEIEVFRTLLGFLQLEGTLAEQIAQAIAATQSRLSSTDERGQTIPESAASAIPFIQIEDLLAVPGITPQIISTLRDHVIFLPGTTTVNANTASAPVLAARIEDLTLSDAAALVAYRGKSYFRNVGEMELALPGKEISLEQSQIDVKTNYFIVNGTVRLGRGSLDMAALVRRDGNNKTTTLIWMREN